MSTNRISSNDIRKIGRPGVEGPVPTGISPVLRTSWRFAEDMARRFSKETMQDRVKKFLSRLVTKW